MFTLSLNYAWGGLDPFGYHLVNLGLHLLCSLLIWALARVCVSDDERRAPAALLAGLIFAVHLLNTEAVNLVSPGRLVLLSALFYFAGLLCFLKGTGGGAGAHPGRRGPWVALAVAALGAGCLSKEWGITLPLVWLLLRVLFPPEPNESLPRRGWILFLLPALAGGVAAGGVLLSLGPRLLEQVSGEAPLTHAIMHVGTEIYVLVLSLRLMLIPLPDWLNHDHHVLLMPWSDPRVWMSALALATLAACAWRSRRTHPLGALFVGLFLIAQAPSVFVPRAQLMVEYRNYIPIAGLPLLAGDMLSRLIRSRPRGGTLGAVALVFALAFCSVQRNSTWRDEASLWTDAAVKSPQKPSALGHAANACLDAGRDLAFIESLAGRAVALDPECFQGLTALARVRLKQGRPGESEALMRRALVLPEGSEFLDRIWLHIAFCRSMERDAVGVREALRQSIRASARPSAETWFALGLAELMTERLAESAEALQRAVELKPDRFDYRMKLAWVFEEGDDLEGAQREVNRVLEQAPACAEARELNDRLKSRRTARPETDRR
ncbi:MAG: hypothetical protein HYY93_03080 [Planctomycetes bacterium]|nr:hypothetical protein [Planctomycetota bacterium]